MPLIVALLFFLVPLVPLCAQGEIASQNSTMRNARYGEIIVVTGGPFSFTGHVYNTIGFSDCPDAAWKALNAQHLKQEFKARGVTLNGPRYFLMDEVSPSSFPKIKSFDGLQARHITNLKIPLSIVLEGGAAPYTENSILRSVGYLFKQGRTVYELISPIGATYLMQSYPQQSDPHFTEADLANIKNRLSLPPGWHFQSRTLDQDLVIKPAAKAYVLRDNLNNSYQKE